jgi:hypothetical protein
MPSTSPPRVGARRPLDLGEPVGGHRAQGEPELEHGVAGERVVHEDPVSAGRHQARIPQDPQVLRGVGEREAALPGQLVDCPLGLGEQLQELEAPPAGQRLGHPGELLEERALRVPVTHGPIPPACTPKVK